MTLRHELSGACLAVMTAIVVHCRIKWRYFRCNLRSLIYTYCCGMSQQYGILHAVTLRCTTTAGLGLIAHATEPFTLY